MFWRCGSPVADTASRAAAVGLGAGTVARLLVGAIVGGAAADEVGLAVAAVPTRAAGCWPRADVAFSRASGVGTAGGLLVGESGGGRIGDEVELAVGAVVETAVVLFVGEIVGGAVGDEVGLAVGAAAARAAGCWWRDSVASSLASGGPWPVRRRSRFWRSRWLAVSPPAGGGTASPPGRLRWRIPDALAALTRSTTERSMMLT